MGDGQKAGTPRLEAAGKPQDQGKEVDPFMDEVNDVRAAQQKDVEEKSVPVISPEQKALDPQASMHNAERMGDMLFKLTDAPRDFKVKVVYDSKTNEILELRESGDQRALPKGAKAIEKTAEDCVKEIKEKINQDISTAVSAAENIDQKKVDELRVENGNKRLPLAAELSFKDKNPSPEEVSARMHEQADRNPQLKNWLAGAEKIRVMQETDAPGLAQAEKDQQKLEEKIAGNPRLNEGLKELKKFGELLDLTLENQHIEILRNIEPVTKLRAAELKAKGLTDAGNIKADNYGIDRASAKELMDAYALVNQAGRFSAETKLSEPYARAFKEVTAAYAQNQQTHVMQIMNKMVEAEKLQKPVLRETVPQIAERLKKSRELTRECAEEADKLDYKFIKSQLIEAGKKREDATAGHDDRERDKQDAILKQLGGVLSVRYEARVRYAKELATRGDYAGSSSWATKAGTESPDIAGADKTFVKLMLESSNYGLADTKLRNKMSLNWEAFNTGMQKFASDQANDRVTPAEVYTKAKTALDTLRGDNVKLTKQLEEGSQRLETDRKKVETELIALEKNKDMDQEQKQVEREKLEKQKELYTQLIAHNRGLLTETNKEYYNIQYCAGHLAMAAKEDATANTFFNEVKANAPEIAKDPEKHLDELIEATRDKSWFERNWGAIKKFICIGAAVVAGLAVGAATVWSGPGAAVFGVSTTLGLMTAMGVGFAAGAAAGWTTQSILDGKMASGRDALEYGVYGASSSLYFAGGHVLAGLMPAKDAAGMLVTVRAISVGRVAPHAIFCGTAAIGDNAIKMAYDNKSFKMAAYDTAKDTVIGTAINSIAPFGKGIFQPSATKLPLKALMVESLRHSGRGMVMWNPATVTQTHLPILSDAYTQGSKWYNRGTIDWRQFNSHRYEIEKR